MNKTFYQAKLVSRDTINVMIFSGINLNIKKFYFMKDGNLVDTLIPSKISSLNHLFLFEIKLNKNFEFGYNYEIFIPDIGLCPIDVNNATSFEGFDDEFYYEGNDLGSRYNKNYTDFAIWAPIASDVKLILYYGSEEKIISMNRTNKGVYRVKVNGYLSNVEYKYSVTNSGVSRLVNDPYGFGTSLNSKRSAVIDLKAIDKKYGKNKYHFGKQLVEASIYELHIRDFTIDDKTNIKEKGKYLGLIEEGRKTKGGNPCGMDYLKYLGISHVQILPVHDYANVDDIDFKKTYNWGYDTIHYFSLEGSYSSNPKDPSERIKEFKQVVNSFHKNNIGVIMDVVFNHIFSYETHDFNKIVPNYFFRRNKDGKNSESTGCGDDIASERKMVRKLIIDSLTYFVKFYDVDGFRFDLMGLLDIKTMNEALEACKKIKKDIIFYGEGWAIPCPLHHKECATIMNSFETKEIGFFNDSYRDILKGSNFNFTQKGYINGDFSYVDGVYYALMGTIVEHIFPRRFFDARQSINYVECHDNHTIMDKFTLTNPEADEDTLLHLVCLANALVAFSFGVPFYHMGQEIGLSKMLQDNTYNMGDKYNKFDYALLDKRFEYATFLKELLIMRKKLDCFKLYKNEDIENYFDFNKLENGGFMIKSNKVKGFKEVIMFVNPTSEPYYYDLGDYYEYIFVRAGVVRNAQTQSKNITVNPYNVLWVAKKD